MIFIYGVPGSGKTYYSKQLSKKLNVPHVEADKWVKKKYGTCQAFKLFGPLNETNAIKGLLAVRGETRENVRKLLAKNESIFEGAFLDPNDLTLLGKVILLVVPDEKQHRKQFYAHREKLLDFSGGEFRAARMIQDYLITEAKKLGIEILEKVK
ncbi:hypothetical protein A2872_00550 [Candidatus Gottesmanbacteria bacterium RIFCSPHIGHO2_01_FULL_42_12]|uniref:Uncharacterized protein n=1 Tax=Candidatus Gottesmanbacteria bacterium RIFCSPHIGHO2_01_FULL_42_12 TaxID=1798377 RepID=A0A1F5Z320_9BACT|nr:MAG: hypothetical protein A2872_00550 [Candidatus Gottesmanbacteria bacterium RIFCSPHIGHO2_01_FULL_42_12]